MDSDDPSKDDGAGDDGARAGASGGDRERRDIVSGEVMPEEALIRFVAGPEGTVVPDLARKLPGRGLWVAARREAVEAAVKRGAFSRAAKAKLAAAPDLADQVERLLRTRLLAGLGLARRAGDLILGFEKVAETVQAGKAAWLIEAADGAADGRRKMLQHSRRATVAGLAPPRLFGLFGSEELGLALGLGNVIHLALLAGRGADRWTLDVERVSGFCPLLPLSWREEP